MNDKKIFKWELDWNVKLKKAHTALGERRDTEAGEKT